MSAPKDTHIAMDVQQMAAYGYFKEEFLYYAYAFRRDGQIVYRLSEDRLALYSAYQRSVFENAYPTPIHDLLKSVMVPAGEQPHYALQIKMALIQLLRDGYGERYYDALSLFQAAKPLEGAYPLLEDYLRSHLLQAETRQLFDGACQLALEAKQLSPASYQALLQKANRLYGEPPAVSKPLTGRGKTFSSFAYSPLPGQKRLYISATLEDTYAKYQSLGQQGVLCSPIVQKSYWYDSPNEFKTIRASYEAFFNTLIAESAILALTAQIKALPSAINSVHYQMALEQLQAQGPPTAVTAFSSYRYRFNLSTDN